jgi:hypothetical protein
VTMCSLEEAATMVSHCGWSRCSGVMVLGPFVALGVLARTYSSSGVMM